MFRIILSVFLSFVIAAASSQQINLDDFTNEQLGSIYYAYPQPTGKLTPSPEGYEPFYISHYGRHGSRWITSDERYTQVLDIFETHLLTPLGENVKERLRMVWEDARGRGGDLTPLGERQHRGIAERMYHHYPQVFQGKAEISAKSSISVRCVMSMAAFTERLKELNPGLQITREANRRYMNYLAYTSPELEAFSSEDAGWRKDFRSFEQEHIRPQRLLASLFRNPHDIADPYALMMGLYWIASDMQDVELNLSFYDIFEKEELFGIWQCVNYRMYVCNAAAPLNKGLAAQSAVSLLHNIIESADAALRNNGKNVPSVTLRFGHDTNLIRLLTLMQVEGCANRETNPELFYRAWQDFRVSPMAGNLQLIFYKNTEGDVLVKFLHNEEEVKLPLPTTTEPYYNWETVKNFFLTSAASYF